MISDGARSGGGLIKVVIPADEKTVGDLLQSVVQGSAAALEPEVPLSTASSGVHPTLRGETAKDGGPGMSGLGKENGRASHDAHLSAIKPREDAAAGADEAASSVA